MAIVQPTQRLLDEIAEPSFLTRAETEAFIRSAAQFATKLAQQGVAELGNVELSSLDETDADLRGSLENYRQKAGVKQRVSQQLMAIVNTLRTNEEQGARYDAITREKAQRAGYATGLPDVVATPDVRAGR